MSFVMGTVRLSTSNILYVLLPIVESDRLQYFLFCIIINSLCWVYVLRSSIRQAALPHSFKIYFPSPHDILTCLFLVFLNPKTILKSDICDGWPTINYLWS